ncbi:chloride anion exchanger-like [Thunnus maccoyii]|uniref:chloride anion exchanger-like n=1 Tax=Thunnus maccoyii TaxID=8240 RepID=UPI001C4D8F9A|nr:chloride anion exchanger-like [Thunnus maccoyii]
MSMEELNLPTDLKDLPFRMNWNAELPTNISVPRVDLHSLILDFSALKGLKMTLKEFVHVDVDVYIVSYDAYILEKLHSCMFFENEILTSMFFLSLHDAVCLKNTRATKVKAVCKEKLQYSLADTKL